MSSRLGIAVILLGVLFAAIEGNEWMRQGVMEAAAPPTLELAFNDKDRTLAYRWEAGERSFSMPIKVGKRGRWQTLVPTTDWAIMRSPVAKDELEVATDLFYVNVVRQ